MRIAIDIDDRLLTEAIEAIEATGAKTEREAVELGLAVLVKLKRQERIRRYRGKLDWLGDLESMHTDR